MLSGASLRPRFAFAARSPRLCRFLSLLLLFIPAAGFAQQTTPSGSKAQQPPKISPLLQEAEDLLSNGSIDEAKKKIEEELENNPSSVEGYNLRGIIYTDQKDFANALEAYTRALKINPNSTRTINNLGHLYVAQNKLDLAEKEFKKVLLLEPGNRDEDSRFATAQALVNSLDTVGRLTDAKLHDFAEAGRIEEVVAALSLMANMPIEFIEGTIDDRQIEEALILAKSIGLSWQTTRCIIRLAGGMYRHAADCVRA